MPEFVKNELTNRTSIIVHAFIPNCFYCSSIKRFVSNPTKATRYSTDSARAWGKREIESEFKNFQRGQIIMHYL